MIKSHGYAVKSATTPLSPFQFERREINDNDVLIEILYCGVCHSDIHQARNEWGGSRYPMVPGHEIVGRVTQVGSKVRKFQKGDIAAVGCMVNSCRSCHNCAEDLEQFCEKSATYTYNSIEEGLQTPTMGGYSDCIVVNEDFALKVPKQFKDLARVAPLLCAGITTYSPLKFWNIQKGKKVGVIGLGGLGHMAIKLARSLGAEVTLFTTSPNKREDAVKLGAHQVVVMKNSAADEKLNNYFDLILDTASGKHDINLYLQLLKRDGVMVLVGVPEEAPELRPSHLINGRRKIAGSLIGGIAETQEMLDYCAEHDILCDIELIPIQKINEAYERMLKGDVKYRFVIDIQSLKQ